MQRDLHKYCHSDVDILRKGSLAFRALLKDMFGVDPFLCATTIASTCMFVFRKCFLLPESIGIVPHGGYRRGDKHR